MKKVFISLLGLALAAGAAPAYGAVTTLDFSGNACTEPTGGYNTSCGTGYPIDQAYGDSAEVDVSYRSVTVATGQTYESFLRYYDGYGQDLKGIVIGGKSDGTTYSEISFMPAAGYEVSLLDFDFAGYPVGSANVQAVPFEVLNGDGELIYSATSSANWPTHNSLAVNSDYFASGITLRWGPESYYVGLDNIRFDVRAIDNGGGVSPVPEPATWVMMIAGFGLAGGAIRARRRLTGLASA